METGNRCPICGGSSGKGTTTFTVDYGSGRVVVRNVSATVCSQCGEAWIDDSIAERLEKIVQEAKSGQKQFEVVSLVA